MIRNVTKILKATSGRLFGRVTSGTGRAEELLPADVRTLLSVSTTAEIAAVYQPIGSYAAASHTHTASQVTDFSEATDDRVAALLTAGTNITITYNDAANTLTIASTAGGLSGTGSVDNAVLRADGTGGATLQNSAWIIADNATASPNNTVNHASLQATGGTANVSVSIVSKGSGAFTLSVPDGTSAGGNARGANAVDLQKTRSAATDVATGDDSFLGGRFSSSSCNYGFTFGRTNSNTSGQDAYILGNFCSTTAQSACAVGRSLTVSGQAAGCFGGEENQATAKYGFVGGGYQAKADRYGMSAAASGQFSAVGDAQCIRFTARNKTTNNTATTLFLDGSSTRLTIPSGKIASLMCRISGIKSDGSAIANYVRRVVIKNVGGTTSLVGSVETIGTDIEDNASTDVVITADDTNDALQISVTGITAETWRWVAVVEGLEIAYGT